MSNIHEIFQKNIEIKQKHYQILSDRLILVPYCKHHVKRYNEWMQDPELQYLTGSEPLTLNDEYKMLESWNHDPEKCTFIILDRERYESDNDEIDSMIGDVNLYISTDPNDDENEERAIGECEIMIAEPSARRKGFGRTATLLMLKFAFEKIGIQKFQVKIKTNNHHSQRMFTEIFGFVETNRSSIFDEITYTCDLTKTGLNHRLRQMFDNCECHYKKY